MTTNANTTTTTNNNNNNIMSATNYDSQIRDRASSTLYEFLLIDLDINQHDTDQQLFLFHVIIPVFSRLGKLHHSYRMLTFILKVLPECSPQLINNLFLPNVITLIEKGNSQAASTTSSSSSSSSVHSLFSAASLCYKPSELDMTLSCGLDLLYVILPDLHIATYIYLLTESNIIKTLLVTIETWTHTHKHNYKHNTTNILF